MPRWLYCRGCRIAEADVLPRRRCCLGDRIAVVAVLPRWPYCRGVNIVEVAVLYEIVLLRWPYSRGGCIVEVVALPRWLYCRGGCIAVARYLRGTRFGRFVPNLGPAESGTTTTDWPPGTTRGLRHHELGPLQVQRAKKMKQPGEWHGNVRRCFLRASRK